jgi:O-methyltransferase domain/Dimerisation domain
MTRSTPASPTLGSELQLTPEKILQTGMSYWGSKTLLSAVELGVFSALAAGPLDAESLRARLGLHPRAARDFFDALVSLGFLERRDGFYANSSESDFFLDGAKPSYIGGVLEMVNDRLYAFWAHLTEALRTGRLQNEAKTCGNFFAALYSDPDRLRSFLRAMTALSSFASQAIAQKFPWRDYLTFADIGTAQGGLPVCVALAHPHLTGFGFDIPVVQPVFEEYVQAHSLCDRLRFCPGDFFEDPLPPAEVFVLGHILHDWSLADKCRLLRRVHDALPPGGACIVFDALIDDARRENTFGLLMSLNMLIETEAGFDYTGADCSSWMREAGFSRTRVEHLAGPDSMVVAIK